MNEWDGKTLARADLASGIVIAGLGLAVFIISQRMPTFTNRGVNPLTAPGIFPSVIGLVLLLCGVILVARSLRRYGSAISSVRNKGTARILGSLALMLVTVALVGRLDFRLVSGGFTMAFAALFLDWRVSGPALTRRLTAVGVTVLITGLVIPTLFQRVFLVRIP